MSNRNPKSPSTLHSRDADFLFVQHPEAAWGGGLGRRPGEPAWGGGPGGPGIA